jgi:hypothetical protein
MFYVLNFNVEILLIVTIDLGSTGQSMNDSTVDMMWAVGLQVRITTSMRRFPVNSVGPTIKFIVEVETDDILPFFDVLVMKRGPNLATKVCIYDKGYILDVPSSPKSMSLSLFLM